MVVAGPLITVGSLRCAERELAAPAPLDWAGRASLQLISPRPKAIERGMMSSARANQTYFEFDSPITEAQEQAMWQAAQIASRPADALASEESIAELRALANAEPSLFYPRFLLAQLTEDEAMLAEAIAAAPRCLVLPVVDEAGNPWANGEAGALSIAVVQIQDDRIDESLVLRYPLLRTDELGRAYLPVFGGIYRMGEAEPALGMTAGEPINGYFAFPGPTAVLPTWTASGATTVP